jgi:hypothetical protein
MIIGLTSDKYGPDKLYDEASTVIQQKLSQIQGVGQVNVGGGALPSVRVEVNPTKLASYGLTMANLQSDAERAELRPGQGQITNGTHDADIVANDQISHAERLQALIVGYKNGAAVACPTWPTSSTRCRTSRRRLSQRQALRRPHRLPPARRQHHRHGRFRIKAQTALDQGLDSPGHRHHGRVRTAPPPSAPRSTTSNAR